MCELVHRIDWGNAPAWFGAVLSFISIGIALYVLNRDGRRHERDQATKMVGYIDYDGLQGAVRIYNTSDQPIVKPALLVIPKRLPALMYRRVRPGFGTRTKVNLARQRIIANRHRIISTGSQVLKKDSEDLKKFFPESPLIFYRTYLEFFDGTGLEWMRELPGGRILSVRQRKRVLKRMSRLKKKYENSVEKSKDDDTKAEAARKRSERIPVFRRKISRGKM